VQVEQELGLEWSAGGAAAASLHAGVTSGDEPPTIPVAEHGGASAAVVLAASRSLISAVIPRHVGFIPRLPLSANGKLARGRLDPGRLCSGPPERQQPTSPGRRDGARWSPTQLAVARLWESAIGLPEGMIGVFASLSTTLTFPPQIRVKTLNPKP